jgi:hypothetical protein
VGGSVRKRLIQSVGIVVAPSLAERSSDDILLEDDVDGN